MLNLLRARNAHDQTATLRQSRSAVREFSSKKLDVINGWRGYAVLAVMIVHSFARISFGDRYSADVMGMTFSLQWILKSGWAGVNAFFIASGFVLYLPYARKSRAMATLGDAASFMKHRALRLVPLCFIGTFVAFIMIDSPPPTDHRFWFFLVNFPFATFSWIQGYNVFNANGTLWSISVEFVLSAVFPILALMSRRTGPARLLSIVVVLWLVFRVLLAVHYGTGTVGRMMGAVGLGWFGMFYGDVVGISLVEFLFGMYCAELYCSGTLSAGPILERFSSALFALGGLFLWAFFELYWNYYNLAYDPHDPHNLVDAFLPLPLDIGLSLMFVGVLWARERSILWTMFTNWPIQIMGLMCYSLYIWHPPLLTKLGNPLGESFRIYCSVLAVVLIFSAVSYRFIEFPKRTVSELFLLSRWRRSPRDAAAPRCDSRRRSAPETPESGNVTF